MSNYSELTRITLIYNPRLSESLVMTAMWMLLLIVTMC